MYGETTLNKNHVIKFIKVSCIHIENRKHVLNVYICLVEN